MKANIKETSVLAIPELISVQIGGRKSVTPKQVLMLVADTNYTTIHLFNGEKFMIARTLKRVQQSLSLHGNFVRTNRKFVVNWDYVQSHCAKQLTLQNNLVIHFSRRQGKLVMMHTAK
jgi:two-component system LytT family response regulator